MDYFPIGHVTELTGILPVTLRAWERRYGLPRPHRTAGGHRLYTIAEVEQLRRVQDLMQKGYTVSRAVERLRAEEAQPGNEPDGDEADHWSPYRYRLLDAVDNFDTIALESAYSEPLSLFPVDLVIDNVLLPVLQRLGDEWLQREDGIAREHFFSNFLRNKIGTRFHHELQRRQGPSLLFACLPGEEHELGLLLAGLVAGTRGFRVLYLGANLPLTQLPPVARRVNPAGIVLSATTVEPLPELEQALQALVRAVKAPVYIGGDMAEQHAARLQTLGLQPVGREFRRGMTQIIEGTRTARGKALHAEA
ncbi:MAG TPA: MerR family transcriptional regulator [Gammaproteobacteria bacterium]